MCKSNRSAKSPFLVKHLFHNISAFIDLALQPTIDAMNIEVKAELSWFSTFCSRKKEFRRQIEVADIKLAITENGQKVIIDNELIDMSSWHYEESVGLLAMKIPSNKTDHGSSLRYYAFEKTLKSKDGDWCWLCQHSCQDAGKAGENIITYANAFINTITTFKRQQIYHIEMTQKK